MPSLGARMANQFQSFDALYVAEHDRLLRFLERRMPSTEEAEDVSQDVWASVYTALQVGKAPETNPKAWLYTIARNRVADHFRLAARLPTTDLDAARYVAAETPGTTATRQEAIRRAVQQGLEHLPAAQRTAIEQVDINGLTFNELAEETGEKMGTWLSRNFYGKKKLRQLMDRFYEELMDNL